MGSLAGVLSVVTGAGVIAGSATVAEATSIDPLTLRVDINGTGPAVEAEAVVQVRQIVVDAFADGTIESIVTLGYGIEGGFSLCVKRSPRRIGF